MSLFRLVALLSVAGFASVSAASRPPVSARKSAVKPAAAPPPAGLPLARRLTLRDRAAQLIIVRGYGDYLPASNSEYRRLVHYIRDLHIGGMIVANRIRQGQIINAQPFEMAAFLNHLQKLSRQPLLIGSDFEHGASMRVAETAKFPYFMAFGAARDLAATRELGAATAQEARALGVQWVFAPDADVNNNPENPIINTRSFGEDPNAVAEGVSTFIDGAHSDPANFVLVAPKHFPGHGDTAEDSHMQLPKLDQPRERIEALELVPFRAAIAHGTDAIMTAHLSVPAFEPNPIPATVSANILNGLLRKELGFRGLTVTDAMDMQGVAALYSSGEAAVRAIEAGADVILMPPDPDACVRAIVSAVASGRLTEKRITESAARVMAAKQKVGLLRSRFVSLDALADRLGDPKLDLLAQRVADEAVTLIKDDKHLFPLSEASSACGVVLTESRFSTRGQAFVSTLTAANSGFKVALANSSMPEPELDAIAASLAPCKSVYVAAFVTVAAYRGSVALEGGLGGLVQKLIRGPAPVALIALGNPYLLRSYPDVSAYAATFSTAVTSETAAAKAILGVIPIRGHLPVSIPGLAKVGDGIEVSGKQSSASHVLP